MSQGNDLFVIEKTSIGATLMDTVDARELHGFLGARKDFSNWIKDRISKYGFTENEDYAVLTKKGEAQPCGLAANRKDYFITIDMAKELSMVERNDKGKQARQYFIRCEKELMSRPSPAIPQDFASALRLAADTHEQLLLAQQREAEKQALIEAQKPDVEFAQRISSNGKCFTLREAAIALDTGGNRLERFILDNAKWMYKDGRGSYRLYSQVAKSGLMHIKGYYYEDANGKERYGYRKIITDKGIRELDRMIHEMAPEILNSHSKKAKAYREATGK